VVDTNDKKVVDGVSLFTPESARVIAGRPFLYDANLSSANGTTSCASCHMFGDMDHLAWDLGNPDEATKDNPNPYVPNNIKTTLRFHPMKGPMSTQTLRGMAGNGPLHWRGDRTGIVRQTIRGGLETIEEASFKEFNGAFVSLLGREAPLAPEQMQAFTDFAMALAVPPNPIRALGNTLTPDEQAGRDIYMNLNSITLLGSCNHCHTLNAAAGRFGTAGLMSFEGLRITENFKVPQLRNVYQKLGMFGFSLGTGAASGAQIRGFGVSHDGSIDTLDSFFGDGVFNFPAPAATTRAQVGAFVLAMDTDFAPIVGQQATWRPGASADADNQLTLLKQRAAISPRRECDLVVRAGIDGSTRSGILQGDGSWLMKSGETLTEAALKQLASASQPLTFTCAVPASGRRVALNLP
jgi:mono/diheme cytochrome c family protein